MKKGLETPMKESSKRMGLPSGRRASELLDLYFLDLRSHLLEVAAGFDRIERAPEGDRMLADPRIENMLLALDILKERGAARACRFLELFSDLS
jgi:hypothetical protein